MRRALLLVGLLLGGAAVAASPAAAQEGCDELVVDETGELDVAALEAAADELRSAGPEPRIRAILDAGGNIDLWAADEVERCRSWQNPDGGTRTNLVVIAVSLDRQSGIFFGDQWDDELGEVWTDIRAEEMNPRFQAGDLTGGLVAGAEAVAAAITDPVPVTPVTDDGGGGGSGGGDTSSGSGWVLVGAAGVAAAGFGGYEVVRRRRRRAEARAAADEAESVVAGRFLDLQERWDLSSVRAEALLDDAAEAEYPAVELRLAELASGLARVGTGMTDAPVAAGARSLDAARARREHHEELTGVLDEVEVLFDDLDAVVTAEESEKARLHQQLEAAPGAVRALRDAADAAARDGWHVQRAHDDADRAEQLAARAGELVEERRFDTAEAPAADATTTLAVAAQWLAQRPALAEQVRTDHTELTAHRADLVDDLAHADRVLTALRADQAERAFAAQADLPQWGRLQLDRFDELLSAAAALATDDEQRFERALDRLADAQRVAAGISERVAALDRLDAELREAERAVPEAIATASTSVRAVERFVEEHGADLPGWDDRVEPLTAGLRSAIEEAQRGDTDWIAALTAAQQAQQGADELRAEAVERVEEVRTARRRAAELATDLAARADALERYLAKHHGDVRPGVDAVVATTRTAIAYVDDDAPARVVRLEAVAETMTRAEDDANADVADAQRRRQRRGGVILVGGGWPGGISGGGFGGGGFGGGGFGGGGFGGGLGGGGGSW